MTQRNAHLPLGDMLKWQGAGGVLGRGWSYYFSLHATTVQDFFLSHKSNKAWHGDNQTKVLKIYENSCVANILFLFRKSNLKHIIYKVFFFLLLLLFLFNLLFWRLGNTPTTLTKSSSSIIDHIYTMVANYSELSVSDHFLVAFTLSKKAQHETCKKA